MKQCSFCKEFKNRDQYHHVKKTSDGLACICKKCKAIKAKIYWGKNKKRLSLHNRLKKYNLSSELFDLMLKNQNNRCLICYKLFQSSFDTHIDHDHITNKIRGLLCSDCNLGIGLFKENKEIISRAILYLNKSKKETYK